MKRNIIKKSALTLLTAAMVSSMIMGCDISSGGSTDVVVDTGNTNADIAEIKTDTDVKVDTDIKVETGMESGKKDDAVIGTASTSTKDSGVTTNGDPVADPIIVEASDSKDTAGNMKQYEKTYVKSSFGCFIDDQAGLFEAEEKKVILTFLNGIYPQHFGPTSVVTIDKNDYESTKDFAREYFNDNYETQDGLIFIIDMKYRTIFIYSRGEFATYVTDAKAEEIISQVAGDATNKEYFKCAKSAASLIAREVGIELMEDESFNGVSF